MAKQPETPGAYPWAAVALLWGVSFLLSCGLGVARVESDPKAGTRSVAQALLGTSCEIVSDHFYENADKYFHKGVGHIRPEAFHDSVFQKVADEISPKDHVHLVGEEVKEMMPWLCFAIKTDPHRIETYLVASFWLATDVNRPDLALNVLAEAQQNNPSSHEIQLEKGCLLLRQNRIAEARHALDTGLAFWPGAGNPDSAAMQYDKARLLLYRAVLHEIDGENREAIAALRRILEIYPARTGLKRRIAELEAGDKSSLLPATRLKHMLKHDARQRHKDTCGKEEEHDHIENHEDSPICGTPSDN